jgi:hypothetical protein
MLPVMQTSFKEKVKAFSLIGAAILISVLLFLLYIGYEEKVEDGIVIGVPDDSGGLLFSYLMHNKQVSIKIQQDFSTYPLRDCCSSAAEWALSSERLHMAVICPEAAKRLVEYDPRYTVLGPILLNSDIIVLREGSVPKKIGITHNRWYQEKIVEYNFGAHCEAIPMLASALPYAYHKDEIDGVVVDITKGLYLEGQYLQGTLDEQDLVTYVLVARKDLLETAEVKRMLQYLEEAVEELTDISHLQSALTNFDANFSTGKEGSVWERMNIKLKTPVMTEKKQNLIYSLQL